LEEVYVPVMVAVPADVPLKVMLQDDAGGFDPAIGDSVAGLVPEKVPAAVPVRVKFTVPNGDPLLFPFLVFVTVTVQVVEPPTPMGFGLHETTVVVGSAASVK
jgi:hypothetical protein